MNRSIEIIVSPNGDVQIDAIGFKGPDCAKATEFLEKALGRFELRQTKPEWHQPVRKTHQQKIGG